MAEFEHPIFYCSVGLMPVSTVLVAPYVHEIAVALFIVGAIGQLSFSVHRSGQLWRGGQHPETITPVLFTSVNIVIGSIALRTMRLLLRGNLLPPSIPVKAA